MHGYLLGGQDRTVLGSPHFEPGEHVPEDPGDGLEGLAVGDGQPVDGARRLPGDPLADAGEAEGVLAVGGL